MSDMGDFARHTDIKWSGDVGTVEYGGGSKGMVVMFYNKAVHNPAKSSAEGRPIFEDRVHVRVHPPGERLNIVDRPASAADSHRWPLQWAQFKENREQVPEGSPIDLFHPENPSVAAMLRANGVRTIEQLSELSANAIETIGMGAQQYVNEAKKYLETANKGVGATQLMKELAERDNKIHSQDNEISLLKQQVSKLMETGSQRVDLDTIKAMLSAAQGRPTFPDVHNVPQQFDAQTAQINATHKTTDLARTKKRPRSRLT